MLVHQHLQSGISQSCNYQKCIKVVKDGKYTFFIALCNQKWTPVKESILSEE